MVSSLHDEIREKAKRITLPSGREGAIIDVSDIDDLAHSHATLGWQIESEALQIDVIPTRYLRNMDEISSTQQINLLNSTIAQVGLGGLGGSLLDIFLRVGIGRIKGADGDHFESSNLNRQALSMPANLGISKASAASDRAQLINPSVEFTPCDTFLDQNTLHQFLHGANVAVDALGGLATRKALQNAASDAGIPLITGALAGWTGYVGVVPPNTIGPADIMGQDNAAEEKLGCPAPAVSLIASLMATETIKILSHTPSSLIGKMLVVDLRDLTFETIAL